MMKAQGRGRATSELSLHPSIQVTSQGLHFLVLQEIWFDKDDQVKKSPEVFDYSLLKDHCPELTVFLNILSVNCRSMVAAFASLL